MADYVLSAKITGDSSGFEKAFASAQKAADSFSSKFDKMGKKISSIGSSLTNKITKPAMAAATAVGGITLVKGWNRLTAIDDAKAKLTGLGHSAESVEKIMESASASVKGTSYGLDEAATTAANAVAAGIKPGEELTQYLSRTADAAAIAGISMSEMGSIINKVQTGQTVYTEDLEQLADRGLPVYQWLAEEAGVAASEVKQLASDGQISAEMLYNAIDKNIGGAAKTIGDTSFTAGLANVGAAIGRIGANFLDAGGKGGGFFSQLKPLISDFTGYLGGLEAKASDLGVKFGEAFSGMVKKVQAVKAKFDALSPSVKGLIAKVAGIGTGVAVGLGPALKLIGPLVSGFGKVGVALGSIAGKVKSLGGIGSVFSALTSPVGLAVTAITALVGAFAYLMTTNEGFRNSVMGTVNTIISSLQPVLAALVPVITNLATTVGTTILSVVQAFQPLLSQIVLAIGQIVETLAPLIAQLISQLAPVLATIITTVGQIVSALLPPLVSVIQAVMEAVQALLPPIMSVLSTAVGVISNIISAVAPIVSFVAGIIGDVISAIAPIITFIAGVIADVISIITPIISFIGGVISSIISAVETVIGPVKTVFSNVYSTISGIWSKISGFISNAISSIKTVISGLTSTVSSVFNGIYSIASSIMGNVQSCITGVFGAIQSAWSGLTSFVSGVFSGISSAVSSLVSSVRGFVNGVIGGINAAIGIINKIPGVSIGSIPYLAHGTDNWQGGFAYMNEGGRGELTYLPNGTQVIPHDISVRYAKEAAKTNNRMEPIDLDGILEGVVIQVINNMTVDGTPLKEAAADYTIKKIGNAQKSVLRSRGAW